jgi:Putative prokaryotic signal transducing protein
MATTRITPDMEANVTGAERAEEQGYAQIATGILDEVGIESMIRADNAGGMYPAISGAELLVRTEDVQKANEALNRRHPPSN